MTSSSNRDNSLVLYSVTLAILFWLLAYRFASPDQNFTIAFFSSFLELPLSIRNSNGLAYLDSGAGIVASFLIFLLVTTAGAQCGVRLTGGIRLLALFQIVAIIVFSEFLLLKAEVPLFFLLSSMTALMAAVSIGTYWKKKTVNDSQEPLSAPREKPVDYNELLLSRLNLIRSDEVDRRTLAGDLHDQVLHGLKMTRRNFQNYLKDPSPESADEIDQGIARSMDEIREVMESLSPGALEHLGFSEAIEELIRKGSSKSEPAYRVRFRCDVDADRLEKLGDIEKSLLYRIVQESVNNIIKHARANMVRCLITDREGKLHITIADDGQGFDTDRVNIESRGMQFMLQRAGIINASINWRRAEKGTGTVVDISL